MADNRALQEAEAITFEIDGMFESGVEEEYLERLVSAAEEGTGQSKLLKDALVTELGNILSKLTEHQIEARGMRLETLEHKSPKALQRASRNPSVGLRSQRGRPRKVIPKR